ncbi:hypothetical protein ACFL6X_06530 [Candidatus Latescibacterota bacterium]
MVSKPDREVLRRLGQRKAEIAADPVNEERRRLWTRLNGLTSQRPMVWLFEVPWNEMNVDDELTLQCEGDVAQAWERVLRREIYQWDHMAGDMVVAPFMGVGPPLHDTGFGLSEKVDLARTDATSSVVSRHFHIQIADEGDIDKIQMPEVTLDREAWDRSFEMWSEIFDGVLPVAKVGVKSTSIAPWDLLVRLTGVDEVLTDMVLRPDYVHQMIDRMTRAFLCRLDQHEALDILATNNELWLGGGPQFTDELPRADGDPGHIRTIDMWGRTMSQIFAAVSPDMHEEFALQYECRWLERFGLTYYGCCEQLDRKVGILRRNVPNLRKISMSPWIDLDVAIDNVGADYVFSLKTNPAVLAEDPWRPDLVRRDLARTLDRLKDQHVEIIMKDISTVRYEPQRLWEWASIADELAAERSGAR